MLLTVRRRWFSEQSTQGTLEIDGQFFCYTLEPRRDQAQGKPYCIPVGTYGVRPLWSSHFQRVTPHLLDVPGFDLIEIHPGNFPHETEGCLLVGRTRHPDILGQSRETFKDLMDKIRSQEPLAITCTEEPWATYAK